MIGEIEVPAVRDGKWRAVMLEGQSLAGRTLFSVTVRDHYGAALRRWFSDEWEALAHAVQKADDLGLPLIDMREPGAE